MTIGMLIAQFIVSPTIVGSAPTAAQLPREAHPLRGLLRPGGRARRHGHDRGQPRPVGRFDYSPLTTIISTKPVLPVLLRAEPRARDHRCHCGTLAGGTACGFFNGVLVGPMRLNSFITTLATLYFFQALAIAYHGGVYEKGQVTDTVYAFTGRGSIGPVPFPLILLAAVFLIFGFLLHRTLSVRRVFAVGGKPDSGAVSGIRFETVTLSPMPWQG